MTGANERSSGSSSAGGRWFWLLAGAALLLSAAYGLVTVEPSYASGEASLSSSLPAGVTFESASTDDPSGAPDPGFTLDVAACLAEVRDPSWVTVNLSNGYPGYTCTFSAQIRNNASLPGCLRSLAVDASPEVIVAGLEGTASLIILPGQLGTQRFSVSIGPDAQPGSSYHFHIDEVFGGVPPGHLDECE